MTDSRNACIDPTAITDDELLVYALNEDAGLAAGHIERCPACKDRAGTLRETATMLGRDAHPPTIKIGELAQGLLPPQEELVVSAHVRSCTSCSEERMRFTDLMDDLQPAATPVERLRRRIVAQLVPPASPAVAVLRGSGGDGTRVYAAEDFALIYLDVEHETSPQRRNLITGQVEQRSGTPSGGVATLFSDQASVMTESLDDMGYFYFKDVRPGSYRLEVTAADLEIVIDQIVLT